jgi:two-component system response regulator AlgR
MTRNDSPPSGLRTLVVDDEPLAIERIESICAGLPSVKLVGSANDGVAALSAIESLQPDLILLDMTMPEMSGLEVAQQAALLDKPPAVIFVTAHDHFAVEAFDLDAVDYVLKPVSAERLQRAVDRATKRRENGGSLPKSEWLDELWVPYRSELIRIAINEVSRIDAERDYVRLHVADRSYLLLQTIVGLEKRLNPDDFIRIHRSTILRKECICGLRHDGLGVWSAELNNGDALRVGRTYLPKVKAMAGR